jgi:hypothetical protein
MAVANCWVFMFRSVRIPLSLAAARFCLSISATEAVSVHVQSLSGGGILAVEDVEQHDDGPVDVSGGAVAR